MIPYFDSAPDSVPEGKKNLSEASASEKELKDFSRLFTTCRKRFIRFADTYVRNRAVAEDATTEAFIYYWEHRHTLTPDSNIPAYILAIIKHKCLHHLEHLRVQEMASEQIKEHAAWELNTRISTLKACEPDDLFANEIQEIAQKTLRLLPERTQQIFRMSRYDNLSYKEIAEHFGITVKGVEFHISKALKPLYRNLKDYLFVFF